jgi:SAM-dependent methyltransferase
VTAEGHGEDRYRGTAGEEYFAWQIEIGRLGAKLDVWKFEEFVRPDEVVADFGCGGGFILDALTCGKRVGVELNPAARGHAASLGIDTHASFDSVPEGSVDLLISNHALEHAQAPHAELVKALRALKPGGRTVFVVPYDGWLNPEPFVPNEINQHLYAWTPLLLGNLFQSAGFVIDKVEVLWSAWTPDAYKWWGWNKRLYRIAQFFICLKYRAPQLRVFARRPLAKG